MRGRQRERKEKRNREAERGGKRERERERERQRERQSTRERQRQSTRETEYEIEILNGPSLCYCLVPPQLASTEQFPAAEELQCPRSIAPVPTVPLRQCAA